MKISTYGGYEIHVPTSGGKAGKGRNATSTVQLRKDNCIVKQFRFRMGGLDPASTRSNMERAVRKAQAYVEMITTNRSLVTLYDNKGSLMQLSGSLTIGDLVKLGVDKIRLEPCSTRTPLPANWWTTRS